jgi:hypothetical protein
MQRQRLANGKPLSRPRIAVANAARLSAEVHRRLKTALVEPISEAGYAKMRKGLSESTFADLFAEAPLLGKEAALRE